MQQETSIQTCLTDEQLEAMSFRDSTEEQRLHLKSCTDCQAKLAEIEHLNALVRQAIQPPEGLNERILTAVRRDASESRHLYRRLWALGGSAAAAAVLIVAGLSVWPTSSENSSSALAQNRDAAIVSQDTTWYMEPQFNGKYHAGGTKSMAGKPDAKVRPVGSAASKTYAQQTASGTLFPSSIEQVWSLPNPTDAVDFLKKVADANHKQFELQENDHYITFAIALKDTEAQELAEKLHAQGWHLLSPTLPQPNSTDNVVFTETPIIYKLKLVKAEQ